MFARGDFADYARAATDAGVTVLGVSDHCPTPSNTATARDCGIPLEINTSGYNKPLKEDTGTGEWRAQYPWEPFWKTVAEEGATVMINSDAYLPESIVQRLDDALTLCDRCGVTPAIFTGVKDNRLV